MDTLATYDVKSAVMKLRSYGCYLPCLASELLCVLDLIEPKILKVHLLFDRVGSGFFPPVICGKHCQG